MSGRRARASVLSGPSHVDSKCAVSTARGRSRTVRGDGGTFEAHIGQRMGDGQGFNSRRGVESECAEALLGTSSGGLFRGPWRNKSERRKATAPFQYALSTRAGCECIAHAIQAMTDANPQCTVLSVDGIGAHDTISGPAHGPFWLKEELHSCLCEDVQSWSGRDGPKWKSPMVGCK